MLRFLLHRLTAAQSGAEKLFAGATAVAREPHWYLAGYVPDTLDGRFRMLATIVALAMVRLERDGARGDAVSVALTERFVAVMESEHRELGLGDPALGRKVRKLVGALAHRVALWRSAAAGEMEWDRAARRSVYAVEATPAALAHSTGALREFWSEIERKTTEDLAAGVIS
jgi:cytochrome b pre-mRNA-processing protein 3